MRATAKPCASMLGTTICTIHNCRAGSAEFDVPTLVLWGDSDRVVCPDYGGAYARMIAGARLELIENAGHHPEIEQPQVFVDHVAGFLEH